MGIRRFEKDQSHHKSNLVSAMPGSKITPESERLLPNNELLLFWTSHKTEPTEVDLRPFSNGQSTNTLKKGGTWTGPYNGRPNLIEEIAPTIKCIVEFASPKTVIQYLQGLRHWWRLLDKIDEDADESFRLTKVDRVRDLTELHCQRACNANFPAEAYYTLIRVANLIRKSQQLPLLYTRAPETKTATRRLPPRAQTKQIRFALKHAWFSVLRRWETADRLTSGSPPENEDEENLQMNYAAFEAVTKETGKVRPLRKEFYGHYYVKMNRGRILMNTMLRGKYPDGHDIRIAFHYCLANSPWNPSVFTAIDVNSDFYMPHPKDSTRYLMYGFKRRGESNPVIEGLVKSQGSPGNVIRALIERTMPLRKELQIQLDTLRNEFLQKKGESTPKNQLSLIAKRIIDLEEGVRSPWIYTPTRSKRIAWLTDSTYFRGQQEEKKLFMTEFITELNAHRTQNDKLDLLKPSDFRDVYADYAYQMSGGIVLHVFKALNHRSLRSTQIYLDNNINNEECDSLYETFSNSLWHEIKTFGRVDPTVLAKHSRDGGVSPEERQRLTNYRNLAKSRIGVGCKDPTHPPKYIAPNFKIDGISMCSVHRCTLCVDNAVVFPESMPGLCKRLAELRHLKSRMSINAFLESSFHKEIRNTEWILESFDTPSVLKVLSEWEEKISSGKHYVLEFDGVQEI